MNADHNMGISPSLKSIALGAAIIFTPFINFLSHSNIQLLLFDEILATGVSLAVFAFLFLTVSAGLNTVRRQKNKCSLPLFFPSIAVGFYLQFYYWDLKIFFIDSLNLSLLGIDNFVAQGMTLLSLGLAWTFLFWLSTRYPRLYIRGLSVFIFFIVVSSLVNNATALLKKDHHYEVDNVSDLGTTKSAPIPIKIGKLENDSHHAIRNIYFVILDGMMSLEHAHTLDIIDFHEELQNLVSHQLRYIPKTLSSYDGTDASLGSIVHMNYLASTDAPNHKVDPNSQFKRTMARSRKSATEPYPPALLQALEMAEAQLIWQGNWFSECSASRNWVCASRLRYTQTPVLSILHDQLIFSEPFFRNSLIGQFMQRLRQALFNSGKIQRTLIPFSNSLSEASALPLSPRFSLIHHVAPHWPHKVTETCEEIEKSFPNDLSGYKANYRCVLQEIETFLQYIQSSDPSAVVILTADHGYPQRSGTGLLEPLVLNDAGSTTFLAKVFSAVRAPCECFANLGIPRSTVNLVRFALGCAFGLKIAFAPELHFSSHHNYRSYQVSDLKTFGAELADQIDDKALGICM